MGMPAPGTDPTRVIVLALDRSFFTDAHRSGAGAESLVVQR